MNVSAGLKNVGFVIGVLLAIAVATVIMILLFKLFGLLGLIVVTLAVLLIGAFFSGACE